MSLGKKMPWQLRSMSSLSLRRKIDLDSLPEGVANLSIGTYRKWCEKEGLPSKKNLIKKYTDEDWEKI